MQRIDEREDDLNLSFNQKRKKKVFLLVLRQDYKYHYTVLCRVHCFNESCHPLYMAMFTIFLLVLIASEKVFADSEGGRNAKDVFSVSENVHEDAPRASFGYPTKTNKPDRRLKVDNKESRGDVRDHARSKDFELGHETVTSRRSSGVLTPANATKTAAESAKYKTSLSLATLSKNLTKLLKLTHSHIRESWTKNTESLHKVKHDILQIENNGRMLIQGKLSKGKEHVVTKLTNGLSNVRNDLLPLVNNTLASGEKVNQVEAEILKQSRRKRAEENEAQKRETSKQDDEDELEMKKLLAEEDEKPSESEKKAAAEPAKPAAKKEKVENPEPAKETQKPKLEEKEKSKDDDDELEMKKLLAEEDEKPSESEKKASAAEPAKPAAEKEKAENPEPAKETQKPKLEEKEKNKDDDDELEMKKLLAEEDEKPSESEKAAAAEPAKPAAEKEKAENPEPAKETQKPKLEETNKTNVPETAEPKPKSPEVTKTQDVDKTNSESLVEYLRSKLPDVMKAPVSKTDDAEVVLLESYAKSDSVPADALASYNAAKKEEREVLKRILPEAGSSASVLAAVYKGLRRGEAWNHTKLDDRFKAFFQRPSKGLSEYEALKKDEVTFIDLFLGLYNQDKSGNEQKAQKEKPVEKAENKAQENQQTTPTKGEEKKAEDESDIEKKGKAEEKKEKAEEKKETAEEKKEKAEGESGIEKMLAEQKKNLLSVLQPKTDEKTGKAEEKKEKDEEKKEKAEEKKENKKEETQETKPKKDEQNKDEGESDIEKMLAEEEKKEKAEEKKEKTEEKTEKAEEKKEKVEEKKEKPEEKKEKAEEKKENKKEETQETKPKQDEQKKDDDESDIEKMLAEEEKKEPKESVQNKDAEYDNRFERKVRAENAETQTFEEAAQAGEAESAKNDATVTNADFAEDSSAFVSHVTDTTSSAKEEILNDNSLWKFAIIFSLVLELSLAIILVVGYRKTIAQWCRRNRTGPESEPLRPSRQYPADRIETTKFWKKTTKNKIGRDSAVNGSTRK